MGVKELNDVILADLSVVLRKQAPCQYVLVAVVQGVAMTHRIESENLFPPVRKIPRKTKCYRGYLSSVAMDDQLRYESRAVEKKLIWFLDFLFMLGLVKSIHPQPFQIEFRHGYHYHPDVLVIFRFPWLKPWLIEGKGRDFNGKKLCESKNKYRSGIGFARQNGYIFHFVTPVQLNCINDDILPFLLTYRGKHVPKTIHDSVLFILEHYGPMSPYNIPDYCKHEHSIDVTVEQVWRLAADGKVFCDLRNNQFKTVVAAPVPIRISSMPKRVFFRLPFILIGGEHD
jgi:hypothetical protein